MTSQHRHDLALPDIHYSGTLPPAAERAVRVQRWGSWYFAEYNLVAARAWLTSTLLAAIGNPVVYLLAMGLGLGAAVSAKTAAIDGVSYLVFVAPALLVSTVIMSVTAEMTFPIMGGFTWHRTFHAAHATPLEPRQIALGHLWAVLVRFVWQSAIFYLIMLVFSAAPGPWGWLTIPIGMMAAASFGAPLMAFSATREDGNDMAFPLVQRFIVMPMFLFAGTFFPLEAMPVYLRWIGWISPVWHGTQLSRVASYGSVQPVWLLVCHVLFLLATSIAGIWLAVRVFERRLRS